MTHPDEDPAVPEGSGATGRARAAGRRVSAAGPEADTTAVVVTYDEFGGQWDHVPPPTGPGVSDQWGPGTRIPALVVSPLLLGSTVSSLPADTTSILATIEARYGLAPLSTRDASVQSLAPLFGRGHRD